MRQTAYTYPVGGTPALLLVPADRSFWNVAPEAALFWQAVDAVRLHARIGTGYGIPQNGQLFVTPAGVAGNNSDLKAQTNVGVDVGAEIALGSTLKAELTGYYEWYRNELVSQSAGVNLLAYTSNVPRSIHRGVEVGLAWRPLPGTKLEASYSYNDQYYTDFAERLTSGATSAVFSRNGNAIPGVIPSFVNARAGYDQPAGPLRGFGGFVEVTYRDRYFIDNGNLLAMPSYTLTNLNLHYDPPGARFSFYASLQNAFDVTYVGSAQVIANSLNAATGSQNPASVLSDVTGSIYAGQPRTVYAGVKAKF
jgi:iron complex outermembrane receptor protein